MKKSITTLFIVAVLLGSLSGYLVSSRVVSATGLPVIDMSAIGTAILNMLKEVARWAIEDALKAVRDTVVKRIVDDLTDQIIDSIENGGKPLFVQDPLGALQREGDIAFDTFNTYFGSQTGVDLCSPFQAQLQIYFQTTYQKQAKYGVPARCTYEQFQQAIRQSNPIERGGWITFQQAFVPSNNFFGASLLVDQAYMSEVSKKVDQTFNAMNRNLGFGDVKKCTRWHNPFSEQPISSTEADYYAKIIALGDGNFTGPLTQDQLQRIENAKNGLCDRWETVTPGSIVAEAATKGVLKDFEYAANVQSVISALINSVLSKVFKSDSGQTSGLLSGHSSVMGSSLDYSSYTGETFAEKLDAAKRSLNDIKLSYFDMNNYLGEVYNKLRVGRAMALRNIFFCQFVFPYQWFNQDLLPNRKNDATTPIGAPAFGVMRYTFSEGSFTHASLGELVESPIASGTTLFPDTWVSLLQPVLGNVPSPPGPPDGYPPREGYFNNMERARKAAYEELNGTTQNPIGRRQKLEEHIQELSLLNPQATSTEEIASSTMVMSVVIGKAQKEYQDFIGKHDKLVSEVITLKNLSVGPGSGGGVQGLNAILDRVIVALSPGAWPYIPGIGDQSNMWWCENR